MENKTESTKEILNRLFKENGLLDEDIHKHQHYTIINRKGIEKIQAKNKVSVHYEVVVMERDFCVLKGIFTKEGAPALETFGSASKETSQNKYYPEMAEKRCLSRGVLKICKFYELGVYGEDESDDFKKAPEQTPQIKPVEAAKPVTPTDAPASYQKPTNGATESQKELIRNTIKSSAFTEAERKPIIEGVDYFTFDKAKKCIDWLLSEMKTRKANQTA